MSAPFAEGISLAVEHPVETLVLRLRRETGARADAPRAACWTDLQAVPPEQPDFSTVLHPEGIDLRVERRGVELEVEHPVFGLYYGFGWEDESRAEPEPQRADAGRNLQAVLRGARAGRGLSQRELAERLGISPVTVARAEEGHDLRRSTLQRYLSLDDLKADDLIRPRAVGTASRDEVWEHHRALLGVESGVERKSLVVEPSGDAHALYETIGLRRLRPMTEDLRIRYGSAPSQEKGWPTELQGVEDAIARKARDSGLKTRVVARHQGQSFARAAITNIPASRI